jgi:hypothetical protein
MIGLWDDRRVHRSRWHVERRVRYLGVNGREHAFRYRDAGVRRRFLGEEDDGLRIAAVDDRAGRNQPEVARVAAGVEMRPKRAR